MNVLTRLPQKSLQELVATWPKLPRTQPYFSKDETNIPTQTEFNQSVLDFSERMKRIVSKRKLVDSIVYKYWTQGLNLLQLSQIDCQLIIDRPNSYFWVKSIVLDSLNKEVPILLAPKKFLNNLISELSLLYLTYIYICKHPKLPLILIRIQVFDLQSVNSSKLSARPHIASRKPYFLAIPMNSPNIIHSPGEDMVTNLILQIVERSLPQNPNNLLRLERSQDQKPIRSLTSMHILNGSSRFSNSLGIWTPYADNTVDMLPLSSIESHVNKKEKNLDLTDMEKLRQIANLRFKGSIDGTLKSARLFDDTKLKRSKRRESTYDLEDEEPSEYASIAPIQYSEFLINEKVLDHTTNIKLKFIGLDVFAGLHELSVLTTVTNDMVVDPAKVPGYLTGEEGESCGVVKDGKYTGK